MSKKGQTNEEELLDDDIEFMILKTTLVTLDEQAWGHHKRTAINYMSLRQLRFLKFENINKKQEE